MKTVKWIIACTYLCISAATFGSNVEGITVSHYEPLQRLSLTGDRHSGSEKPGVAEPLTMSFDALGQSFRIELEQNTKLFSARARAALPQDVGLYRGRLAGKPDSWARISIVGGMPGGLIWDGSTMYAVEAPGVTLIHVVEGVESCRFTRDATGEVLGGLPERNGATTAGARQEGVPRGREIGSDRRYHTHSRNDDTSSLGPRLLPPSQAAQEGLSLLGFPSDT